MAMPCPYLGGPNVRTGIYSTQLRNAIDSKPGFTRRLTTWNSSVVVDKSPPNKTDYFFHGSLVPHFRKRGEDEIKGEYANTDKKKKYIVVHSDRRRLTWLSRIFFTFSGLTH
jgi:hypothetical protein